MGGAALVVGGPRDRQVALMDAFASVGVAAMSVPDAVAAMAALGRADFRAIVVADASKANHVSLRGLCRIAQMRHPGVVAVVLVEQGGASKVAEGVNALVLHEMNAPVEIVRDTLLRMEESTAREELAADDDPFSEPTIVDTSAPALLEGMFADAGGADATAREGGGAAVLVTAFSQELTGKLEVGGGPAEGALWFLQGEPVAADDPQGDEGLYGRLLLAGIIEHGMVPDDLPEGTLVAHLSRIDVPVDRVVGFMKLQVRDRVLALVEQTTGTWAFFQDPSFAEHRTVTRVNPFGLILEARRRRTSPASVLETGSLIESKYVVPGPGLDRAAPKLHAFTRGQDLTALVDGTRTVKGVLESVGLDPLMGTLVMLTLQDTRLVTLTDTASAAVTVPLTALRPRTEAKVVRPPVDVPVVAAQSPFPPWMLSGPMEQAPGPEPKQPEPPSSLETSRYEVLEPLGRGGMAEVHLGRQIGQGFEKRVVIKRILKEYARDEEFVAMFLEEARVAARISHPNVVQILDLGKAGDDHYIVMEFVHGGDLDTLLDGGSAAEPFMPYQIAGRVIADCAAGLHAAHSWIDEQGRPSPIIHRDVSPQNVLLSVDGHVKLTDFGVAKAAGSRVQTLPGQRKGKIPYSAPEYLRGAPASVRSDVFSLGIVLYQCLVRDHPFAKQHIADSLDAILSGDMIPLRDRRPGVPEELEAIVCKALANDPAQRYESALAMADALEAWVADCGFPSSSAFVALWVDQALGRAKAKRVVEKRKTKAARNAPAPAEQSLSLDAMANMLRSAVRTETNIPVAAEPKKAPAFVIELPKTKV